jgi:hypothetical protein
MARCHRKKGRKRETPSVESEVRRSTRFQVKQNGYKLEPMRDKPTPKNNPRSSKPFPHEPLTTFTTIPVLQKVGKALEVPEEEMIVDKLMSRSCQRMVQMNRQPQVHFVPCLGDDLHLNPVCVATILCPFKTIYVLSTPGMYLKYSYALFCYTVLCLDNSTN